MKAFTLLAALVFSALASSPAYASGTHNADFGYEAPDQRYEQGKALSKKRIEGIGKVKLCMDYKGKEKKIGRKTLKPYKGQSKSAVIEAIYLCKNPEKGIKSLYNQSQLMDIIYYYNKRYALKLN